MRFEVVVVAYQSRVPLGEFLSSLGPEVPVLVVDNSADLDDLSDLIDARSNTRRVDAGANLGFSAAANLGGRVSDADYLVFMNPDTLPEMEALSTMVAELEQRGDIASCGAAGIGTAGGGAQPTVARTLVHTLGLHKLLPMAGIYFYPRNGDRREVGWISGSCLAIRRTDFLGVGGFDEGYFVFMSDFALGRRLAETGRIQLLLGAVTVPHVDGGSSDIPAQWTWSERGKGWAQFLRRTEPIARARLIAAILVAGFIGRRGMYTLARRPNKAAEMAAYARAFVSEWSMSNRAGDRSDGDVRDS